MNSIEVTNLTKSYNDFKLDNISFDLPSGTIMGLVGENGAGKSTTIKLIMNAIKADNGNISVLGVPNISPEFTKVKNDIGIVLDEAYFPEVLNATKINKVMQHTFSNWSESVYSDYLRKFQLPLSKKFSDYSRGMKMKLAIAVALSHNPKLLILDEATSGLDPIIRDEILDVFNDFTKDENHSILLSSHIISDLEKICDYITFLHHGKLIICEEKDILLQKYAVVKLAGSAVSDIPADAIVRKKKTNYGYDLLILKNKVNKAITTERTSLEDIILFLSKEAN